MNVELIDYTGKGSADPWYAARLLVYTKNTRLEQGADTRSKVDAMTTLDLDVELEYISKTIRSSWEFVDFVFEVRDVTRAYTHQAVRTRTASYAQQAQRVVDMSHFGNEMPETVAKIPEAKEMWEATMSVLGIVYADLQKMGIPNQDCRGLLPTNVHTNIIIKMNLRTFADLVGKRQNLRAQGEYADVVREMTKKALDVMPWLHPFLYPERTATPALDDTLKRLLGNASPVDVPLINKALKEVDALKATWG